MSISQMPKHKSTLISHRALPGFSADAIVTFADPDLAEVVNEALGLDAGAALSCGQAAEFENS